MKLACLTLALSLTLSGAITYAQSQPVATVDPANVAAARALFDRGVSELEARRYTPAVLVLEESYRLNPVPVVLYNLGLAHRALGHHQQAIESFERYLADAGADVAPARLAAVQQAVSQLRAELVTVTCEVRPEAFHVAVDGRDIRVSETRFTLDPGAHSIVVSADEHRPERREVRLAPGERYTLHTTLEAAPRATPHPPVVPVTPEARPITSQWWFWTVIGAVVVGGVATTLALTLRETEGPVPGTQVDVMALGAR